MYKTFCMMTNLFLTHTFNRLIKYSSTLRFVVLSVLKFLVQRGTPFQQCKRQSIRQYTCQ